MAKNKSLRKKGSQEPLDEEVTLVATEIHRALLSRDTAVPLI